MCSWLFAGKPEYPAVPVHVSGRTHTADMFGENPSGAGNQQERPDYEQWVVGFVDGEGCFSVPIFKNATTKCGWQVQPEFVVVQGERSVHVLHELMTFFGCGSV